MFILPINNIFCTKRIVNIRQTQSFGILLKEEYKDTFEQSFKSKLSESKRIYGKDVFEETELFLRDSDKRVPAYIVRKEYDDLISFEMYVENDGKIGNIFLQLPDQADNKCIESSNLLKNFSENAMTIYYVFSENDGYGLSRYKGIGTELIKSAVRESNRNGYDGRLIVSAANGYVSPVPFYYKCGFRFEDEELNKSMEEFIHSKSNKLPPDLFTGIMYLSDKNAESLLSK